MRSHLSISLALVILVAIACPVCAQETAGSPSPAAAKEEEKEGKSPSLDGKFAFLTNYEGDLHTIDLIDPKSKKVVLHVAEEDSEMVHYNVLWAPDSKRFALMTRYGHPIQGGLLPKWRNLSKNRIARAARGENPGPAQAR